MWNGGDVVSVLLSPINKTWHVPKLKLMENKIGRKVYYYTQAHWITSFKVMHSLSEFWLWNSKMQSHGSLWRPNVVKWDAHYFHDLRVNPKLAARDGYSYHDITHLFWPMKYAAFRGAGSDVTPELTALYSRSGKTTWPGQSQVS